MFFAFPVVYVVYVSVLLYQACHCFTLIEVVSEDGLEEHKRSYIIHYKKVNRRKAAGSLERRLFSSRKVMIFEVVKVYIPSTQYLPSGVNSSVSSLPLQVSYLTNDHLLLLIVKLSFPVG